MTSATLVLLLSSTTWRLGAATRAAGSTWGGPSPVGAAGETADAIIRAVGAAKVEGPLTIALAADLCLPASIAIDDLPRRERRQAMIYRLEEQFPLAAEDFACGFVESADRRRALGIATRVAASADLVAAIEARGQPIASITPAAIAVLATLDVAQADVVVWRADAGFECFFVQDGRPAAWYSLADPAAVARHVGAIAAKTGRPICGRAGGLDAATTEAIHPHGAIEVLADFRPLDALLAAASRRAEIERRGLWVDLRRDGFATAGGPTPLARSLAFAAAGVSAMFLAIGAAALYRAAAHDRVARATSARLEAIYAELFPRAPMPIAILSRLTSEARRVTTPSPSDVAEARPAAARTLFNVLARVPRDGGFSVTELRLAGDDAAVTLEGEAKSFNDAQAFANAIRGDLPGRIAAIVDGGGLRFDVEPPRTTQREDKSVSFAMTARPSPLALAVPANPDAKPDAKSDAKPAAQPTTRSDADDTADADSQKVAGKALGKLLKRGAKR